MGSWELLEDVAPIDEMTHSAACGRTSAVARFWSDLVYFGRYAT